MCAHLVLTVQFVRTAKEASWGISARVNWGVALRNSSITNGYLFAQTMPMPRAARVTPGGMVYHVLNRSLGRMHLFRKDADIEPFHRVMIEAYQRRPIRVQRAEQWRSSSLWARIHGDDALIFSTWPLPAPSPARRLTSRAAASTGGNLAIIAFVHGTSRCRLPSSRFLGFSLTGRPKPDRRHPLATATTGRSGSSPSIDRSSRITRGSCSQSFLATDPVALTLGIRIESSNDPINRVINWRPALHIV